MNMFVAYFSPCNSCCLGNIGITYQKLKSRGSKHKSNIKNYPLSNAHEKLNHILKFEEYKID